MAAPARRSLPEASGESAPNWGRFSRSAPGLLAASGSSAARSAVVLVGMASSWAFVGSVPIESVMTDRDLRVLTATPRWL